MCQRTAATLCAFMLLAPQLAASTCSGPKANCNVTKCCTDKTMTCFEKNPEFADCRPSCAPGIHPDDGKDWRTKWSCKQMSTGCAVAFQPCGGTTGKTCCDGCKCTGSCQPPRNEHACAAGVKTTVRLFSSADDERAGGHPGSHAGVAWGFHAAVGVALTAAVSFSALLLWKGRDQLGARSQPLNFLSTDLDAADAEVAPAGALQENE